MIIDEQRLLSVKNWLKTVCAMPDSELIALPSDASFRRYFRYPVDTRSYVVMVAPPNKEELIAFISIAKNFSEHGIHVPEVLEHDINQGFILLSDLGDALFLNILNDNCVDDLYTRALSVIPNIQVARPTLGSQQELGVFDEAFMRMEFNLFVHWFLSRHLSLNINSQRLSLLENIFQPILTTLSEQTRVCVHRDYHSRNLLLLEEWDVGVLDFQDALYGPITYDAVSLLRDAYIDWPAQQVQRWVLNFRTMLPNQKVSEAQFLYWFDLTSVQRHLKILGIFARLCYRDNKPHYLANTQRITGYLKQVCEKHAELSVLKQLLAAEIQPRLQGLATE